MSDPLIRACDEYVVLEPGKAEKILSSAETLLWLENWLEQLNELPLDLQNHRGETTVAQRLLDTACELEVEPGFSLQWFAVRQNPPKV